jgi:hypothetical protein
VNTGFEDPQNETIYSLLKQKAGYNTAHVGKLGLLVSLDQELNFIFLWSMMDGIIVRSGTECGT